MPYKSKPRKSLWNKTYYQQHPERYRAEQAVRNAKRNGTLLPQPCAICGAIKTECHHQDYDKPLEVTWLCKHCHRLVHNGKLEVQDAT